MVYVETVLAFGVVALVWCAMMLWRNQKVYRFTGRMIDVAYEGNDWEKLSAEYRSVSYNDMVLSFRPLESFYEGTELLKRYREKYGKK